MKRRKKGKMGRKILGFILGAIAGGFLFIKVILPFVVTSLFEKISFGAIALLPAVTIGGGILSLIIGGILGSKIVRKIRGR